MNNNEQLVLDVITLMKKIPFAFLEHRLLFHVACLIINDFYRHIM